LIVVATITKKSAPNSYSESLNGHLRWPTDTPKFVRIAWTCHPQHTLQEIPRRLGAAELAPRAITQKPLSVMHCDDQQESYPEARVKNLLVQSDCQWRLSRQKASTLES